MVESVFMICSSDSESCELSADAALSPDCLAAVNMLTRWYQTQYPRRLLRRRLCEQFLDAVTKSAKDLDPHRKEILALEDKNDDENP